MLVDQKVSYRTGRSFVVPAIAGKHFSISIKTERAIYRLVWKDCGTVASFFEIAECLVGCFNELELAFWSQDSVRDMDLVFDILDKWWAIESKHPEYYE